MTPKNPSSHTVFWGDRIALQYQLSSEDGTAVAFSNFDEDPVTLTLGENEIEPILENCLIDLEIGRRYTFKPPPEQAFGPTDPERVMEVPLEAFHDEIVTPGNLIEFTLPDGDTLTGLVQDIGKDSARVDFNHPLSGCTILFEVRITDVLEHP